MKTMIIKELKENYKWAILGFSITLFFLFFLFNPKFNNRTYSILDYPIVELIAFLFATIGFIFGVLQTAFDRRENQWHYLLHRPIDSSQLFYAKILSGIFLYFLATLLPYFVFVIYTRQGHIAQTPFTYHQLSPALIDWVNGLVCYLAGALFVLRKARWYVSRPLIVGGAIASLLMVLMTPKVYIAFMVEIFFGVFLFISVKNHFNLLEKKKFQTVTSKFSNVFNIYLGMQWVLIGLCIFYIFVNREKSKTRSSEYIFYEIDKGTENVVRIKTDFKVYKSITPIKSGAVLSEALKNVVGKDSNDRSGLFLKRSPFYSHVINYHYAYSGDHYRNQNSYFSAIQEQTVDTDGGGISDKERVISSESLKGERKYTFWYLCKQDNKIYGYQKKRTSNGYVCEPIGVIKKEDDKRKEFSNKLKANTQIDGFLQQNNMVLYDDGLYKVDFKTQDLVQIFKNKNSEKVINLDYVFSKDQLWWHEISILTDENFYIITKDGKLLWQLPLKNLYLKDIKKYEYINLTQGKSKYYLLCQARDGSRQVEIFSQQGELLHHQPLSKTTKDQYIDEKMKALNPFGLVVTPFFMIFSYLYLKSWNSYTLAYFESFKSYDVSTYFFVLLFIGVLIGAILTFIHGRKHSLNWQAQMGWSVFSLFFGLAGFLSYLCLWKWPMREACSSCHKKRVINRQRCEHCGQEFDPPALDGTEVFA